MNANESKVFYAVCEGAYQDCGYDVEFISKIVELTVHQVKGYIGSLAKKGAVRTMSDRVNGQDWTTILPTWAPGWFLSDEMGRGEFETRVHEEWLKLKEA